MTEEKETRKGARTRAEVPEEIRRQLNAGELETANLVEGLVVDFAELLAAVHPAVGAESLKRLRDGAGWGVTRRMKLAAEILHSQPDAPNLEALSAHRSDTVRGWSAYRLALEEGLTLAERLDRLRPLADDPHFGVREWSWLAIRDHVADEIETALELLQQWAADPAEGIRRFASEVTRPRGVWAKHITRLKAEPELGQPLLEALRADPSRYVQNSVANWLNDAARDRPEWVLALTEAWGESDSPHTKYIIKRARRNLSD